MITTGPSHRLKSPGHTRDLKHILRRFHLIQEIVERGDVKICKIPGETNVADPLTKQLARPKHEGRVRSFGLRTMFD